MDGRIGKKLAVASLLLASVGCRTSKPSLASGLPAAPAQSPPGNMLSRLTQPKPPGAPKAQFLPAEAVAESSKKKTPLKPDTIAAFANAQVGAAFDFQEEGKTNPNLDRMADDARQKFQKALEADPKNKEALQGLARLYTRLGDRERAIATLQTLLKHYPNDHKSIYELALTHARFEDWPSAEATCQVALQGDPENRRYLKTLGILAARNGKLEQGFDMLVRVSPEAEARFTMAKLLADMEKSDLAYQQLQMAAKADPTFAPAQDWLAAIQNPQTANSIQQVEARQPIGN